MEVNNLAGLLRKTREEENSQQVLFEDALLPNWKEHWWGMPSFEQKNALPEQRITVNFMCYEDVKEFARRLGVSLSRESDTMWFPSDVVDAPSEWEYADES